MGQMPKRLKAPATISPRGQNPKEHVRANLAGDPNLQRPKHRQSLPVRGLPPSVLLVRQAVGRHGLLVTKQGGQNPKGNRLRVKSKIGVLPSRVVRGAASTNPPGRMLTNHSWVGWDAPVNSRR